MLADQDVVSDEEWREEKFTEEELISARLNERFGSVTLTQLKDALAKYGPDGILETATLLPRRQYEELEQLCKKVAKPTGRVRLRRK